MADDQLVDHTDHYLTQVQRYLVLLLSWGDEIGLPLEAGLNKQEPQDKQILVNKVIKELQPQVGQPQQCLALGVVLERLLQCPDLTKKILLMTILIQMITQK